MDSHIVAFLLGTAVGLFTAGAAYHQYAEFHIEAAIKRIRAQEAQQRGRIRHD